MNFMELLGESDVFWPIQCCGRIRLMRVGTKIFQKSLATGARWVRVFVPMRTGAPFFLFERRSDGPATYRVQPARFIC